jgi:hypothetical protein
MSALVSPEGEGTTTKAPYDKEERHERRCLADPRQGYEE